MKSTLGVIFLIAAVVLILFVEAPMQNHLENDPRSAQPDVRRGLVVPENCHGTTCYMTKENAEREDNFFIVAPLAVLLLVTGVFLVRASDNDDRTK